MKLEIVSRGYNYVGISMVIIFSLVIFPYVYLDEMGKSNKVFTIIAVMTTIIYLIYIFSPKIIKPKIIGKAIFSENALSIIEKGEEQIINFSNIDYIKINYSYHHNEVYTINLKMVFSDGVNFITIKTKEKRIKFYFFSKDGEEENMIRKYLYVFEKNNVSYKVIIRNEVFRDKNAAKQKKWQKTLRLIFS